MKKILCLFINHDPTITFRNNTIAINLEKETIMIWVICKRCKKDMAIAEFNSDQGYYSELYI